jgi:hypothetical protein
MDMMNLDPVYAAPLVTSKKLALHPRPRVHPPQTPSGLPRTRQNRSAPLTRFRTTLVCSGQNTLRTRNLYERYRTLLAPALRDSILNAVPGGWFPLEVAMGHLAACDALGMSSREAFESGAITGNQVTGVALDTIARLAGSAGATPWTVLGVYGRLLRLVFDGGDFTIDRLGPKEARVEHRDMPPFRFAYFRDAFRGASYSAMGRFAASLQVDEIPESAHPAGFAMRVAWT